MCSIRQLDTLDASPVSSQHPTIFVVCAAGISDRHTTAGPSLCEVTVNHSDATSVKHTHMLTKGRSICHMRPSYLAHFDIKYFLKHRFSAIFVENCTGLLNSLSCCAVYLMPDLHRGGRGGSDMSYPLSCLCCRRK